MWLNICQGLMLVGWLLRLSMNMIYAMTGREKIAPSGAVGAVLAVMWAALNAAVLWRSGALSTILPTP